MIKKFTILLLMVLPTLSWAQDPQFTQFSAIPMYLNPGFTGTTLEYRASMISRIQWPGAAQPFFTNAVAFDYNRADLRSGFGALITSDVAGETRYRSTTAGLLYSYRFSFGNGWMVRPGLNFGLGVRDINFGDLVFGNQLVLRGQDDTVISDDAFAGSGDRVTYFDFSSGAVMYNQTAWFGMGFFHINQPNISLIDGTDRLPMRWTIHGGFRIPMFSSLREDKKIPEIAPAILYQNQGKFDQLDLGLYMYYASLQFGLWYRGLPLASEGSPIADNIAFLFGYQSEQWNFAYSYDFVTSDLSGRTGGSHEISLSFQFYSNPNRKPRKGDYTDVNKLPPFLRQSFKKKY